MQLELQNLWWPVITVLILGLLLRPSLSASQDLNDLPAVSRQSEYPSQTSSTINILKSGNVDYPSIADMFLIELIKKMARHDIGLNLSFGGLFPQGTSLSQINEKPIANGSKSL
jgi:hypothetical protein|tara:strand:+ start:252 stop:593 length:342 start_codon:yes stop_codon:yes gene_type:complete